MKHRLLLTLPACLLGIPLLLVLLLASDRLQNPTGSDLPPPTVSKTGPLPDEATMDQLAKDDPVSLVEWCLVRYKREVKGYTLTMQKQERLAGKLQPKEIMKVHFRDEPHSVFMQWIEGARKADRVLFVDGENMKENKSMMIAHPAGLAGRFVKSVEREIDSDEARQSGRYTLDKFGIKKGTERTLSAWEKAKQINALHVEYLGKERIKEAGDRPCWILRRTNEKPENDGVMEMTVYIDAENWLQIGSLLKGEKSAEGTRPLIGEYYWRDIQLNPDFKPDQFKPAAVAQ